MSISDQSIIKYAGKWPTTFFLSADQVAAQVGPILNGAGLVIRSGPTYNASFSTSLGGTFDVTMDVQVENGLGFATTDDIVSVIRNAVYQVTGTFPLSDSVPYVQDPNVSSTPQATGQPANTSGSPTPGGCIAGSDNDTTGSFSLACWWSNLSTKGLAAFGTFGIVALFGIILFALSFRGTIAVPHRAGE